jgi:hypothetical protein
MEVCVCVWKQGEICIIIIIIDLIIFKDFVCFFNFFFKHFPLLWLVLFLNFRPVSHPVSLRRLVSPFKNQGETGTYEDFDGGLGEQRLAEDDGEGAVSAECSAEAAASRGGGVATVETPMPDDEDVRQLLETGGDDDGCGGGGGCGGGAATTTTGLITWRPPSAGDVKYCPPVIMVGIPGVVLSSGEATPT